MKKTTAPTQTRKSLSRVLREIPDSVLFDSSTNKVQFNRVLGEVFKLRGVVSEEGEMNLSALWGPEAPNLSSFQRAVAKEASVRRKRLGLPTTRGGFPPKGGASGGGEPPADDGGDLSGSSGVDASGANLDEIYGLIQKGAAKALNKYSPLKREHTAMDVANSYFADYVEKGFHKKYDPSKGVSLSAWIGLGLKRWAVDRLRDKRLQFKQGDETVFRTISGDLKPLKGGPSLLEMYAEQEAQDTDPLSSMIVREALSKLDRTTREAVELRLEDFNMREIAEKTGASRSQVSKTLARAREDLSFVLV